MSGANGLHIFLAEDDQDDAFLFVEAVNQLAPHTRVTIAEDGVAFMSCLKDNDGLPDLIFLDVNIPLRNGLECLYDIRALAAYNQVPVIFLSTSTDKVLLNAAFAGGATLFIQKPSSFKDLKSLVGQCLQRLPELLSLRGREQFLLSDTRN